MLGNSGIIRRISGSFGAVLPMMFLFICIVVLGEFVYFKFVFKKRKEQGLEVGVRYYFFRYMFYLYLMMVYLQTGITGAAWTSQGVDLNRIYLVPFTTSPDITPYLLNILMTIPLGFLLPLIWSSFRKLWKVTLAGFLLSFGIEFTQLFSQRVTSTSDLVTNTMGAVIGYGIFYLLFRWVANGEDVINSKIKSKLVAKEASCYLLLSFIGAVFLNHPQVGMILPQWGANEGVIFATAPYVEFYTDHTLSYDDVDFSIYSQNALLINLTTGEVIFDHGADERVYPASLTKIMTVLIGIEQATSDVMTVQADFDGLMLANASVAGFSYGEVRTLSEILHGAMLPSGADATATIAYNIAGSYEAFVELMNQRARELGMYHTNFTNTSGLHDENQYTTAYDLALLLRHALNNSKFREIFTTRTYHFTTLFGEQRIMYSTLFSNIWTTEFSSGEIIGGRTGFTDAAGRCLASLATNGVDEFILITFGADQAAANQNAHLFDAITIYDYFLAINN